MKHSRGTTNKARAKTKEWLLDNFKDFIDRISIGLPEYDDRVDRWVVPLHPIGNKNILIGNIRLDNQADAIIDHTEIKLITNRANNNNNLTKYPERTKGNLFYPAPVPNKVILGDSNDVLLDFPPDTAQLIFTSPPYYNAKPEYSEYLDYQEYLDFIRRVFLRCHTILSEGRFFVVNISPVLIRRTSRKSSSKRIAIPFDFHGILEGIGFDFIDDIIWVKPEGAGWNLGRGRRFRADRKPLQYKPVPVTEYVLIYRKRTDKLIDWNLRKHHDLSLVEESRILGDYDVTNLWEIHPANSKIHPAVFPEELASKIIKYYSFKDDLILDPFAGIGTTAKAAFKLGRRFLMVDNDQRYYNHMRNSLSALIQESVRVDYQIHENFNIQENGFLP